MSVSTTHSPSEISVINHDSIRYSVSHFRSIYIFSICDKFVVAKDIQ